MLLGEGDAIPRRKRGEMATEVCPSYACPSGSSAALPLLWKSTLARKLKSGDVHASEGRVPLEAPDTFP